MKGPIVTVVCISAASVWLDLSIQEPVQGPSGPESIEHPPAIVQLLEEHDPSARFVLVLQVTF